MASFHSKTFATYDDYETPDYAWDQIAHIIPPNKTIWEPFFCTGSSGTYLQKLGFDVVHEDIDFFEHDHGDMIVSNIPFSLKKEVLTRLKDLGKPFIIICPSSMLMTKYLYNLFKDDLQIIVPPKRIQFIKDGIAAQGKCNFDCFYYCWRIGLPRDITFLPRPARPPTIAHRPPVPDGVV